MMNQGNKYFNALRKNASLVGSKRSTETKAMANKSELVTTSGDDLIASLAARPRDCCHASAREKHLPGGVVVQFGAPSIARLMRNAGNSDRAMLGAPGFLIKLTTTPDGQQLTASARLPTLTTLSPNPFN